MPEASGLPDEHFCDTNIVIGYTVDWSTLNNPVATYFDCLGDRCVVHFSERAIKEAKTVIQRHRRFAKRAARLVFEKFSPTRDHSQLEHIEGFLRSELGDGFRGPSDSEFSALMVFIEEKEHLFEGFAKHGNETIFEDDLLEITDAFDEAIAVLTSLLDGEVPDGQIAVFNRCEDDYAFYSEFEHVEPLFPHETVDLNLLFDAFHFRCKEGYTIVAFVTNDHDDFISNRDAIQAELDGLCIHTPDEVVELARSESV